MSLRKRILLFFIFAAIVPIIFVYAIALFFFNTNSRRDMQAVYTRNIAAAGQVVENTFSAALDMSIYPLIQNDMMAFLNADPKTEGYAGLREQASRIVSSSSYGYSNNLRGFSVSNTSGQSLTSGICPQITPAERQMVDEGTLQPYWLFPPVGNRSDAIYLTRLLRSPKDLKTTVGYAKVSISKHTVLSQLENRETGEDITYYLIGPEGVLLSNKEGADDPFAGQAAALQYSALRATARGSVTEDVQSGLLLSAYEMDRAPFLLVSLARPLALSSSGQALITGFSIAAAFVVVFSCVLVLVVSNVITVPLKKLGQDMEALSNEDFSVRGEVRGKDEIARLTHHFNTMAGRLDYLYREVYMGQLQLQQAQLKTLQTQISPHFLYNTLDTIYWMNKLGDNEKAGEMTSNLSQLMRFTLTPGENLMVPLREEMEYLKSYIGIQRIRYGDGVSFEIDCPEELQEVPVLKLLLQPLVENALVHGLAQGEAGVVRIRVYTEADALVYDVMNNGTPIQEEQVNGLIEQPIEGHRGFALHNIAQRVKLKNGGGHTLRCFVQGEYSVFRVTQKLARPEEASGEKEA